MARSRRRSSPAPFRHWGLVLLAAAVATAAMSAWRAFVVVMVLALLYVLFLRLARCRVETLKGLPCRWRVRGFLGTCQYHVGDKRVLPRIVHGRGRLSLPTVMWPRMVYSPQARPDRTYVPPDRDAIDPHASRPGYDWAMMGLGVAGLLVALASFVRDLIAG